MKLKTISNSKGSALLWVILMTIIITILLGAVMSATYAYFNYTMYTVKRQQAYFTARSAISACLEEFTSVEQTRDVNGSYNVADISILPDPNKEIEVSDFGFDSKMGTAKATISRNDEDEVKVTVTATYADENYTMEATVVRQPLYFAGISCKNLTLNGNLNLGAGTDFYWNNTEKFMVGSGSSPYKLNVNGNFVSKGDARIPAGMTVAGHKFNQTVDFTNDGRHARKIWNPNEYIISNKTLTVGDDTTTEYTTNVLNTLSRITDTHPYYCNSRGETKFGGYLDMDRSGGLYSLLSLIGMGNMMDGIADDKFALTNSETDALAIQYVELLSLSTTISNAVANWQKSMGPIGSFLTGVTLSFYNNFIQGALYDTLDVSYIDYQSSDEANRSDEVVPLLYMFVRGGDNNGLTVRVRYGANPGNRTAIGKFTENITNNISGFITNLFDIHNKPSYSVIYLENKGTIHLGYDDDGGRRENGPQDLVFLYSIYGGDNTTVHLHDGVVVLGEIICDNLIVDGNAQVIYTSTSGSQIAKQKIAEYWAVSNYSD
ncbi:MAG: hypothetical protein KBS82_04145 [Oscillospiraceae bacterium]|nr:hypothetical protein [Candidatus Limimonas egerieequi]